MKKKSDNHYFLWGLTAFCAIAASILFFFSLFRIDDILRLFGRVISILMPFIYGFLMAYLLNPVYNFLYGLLLPRLKQRIKKPGGGEKAAKGLATALSILVLLIVVTGLVWLVLPQVVTSVMGLVESNLLQDSIQSATIWFDQMLKDNPEFEAAAQNVYKELIETVTNWLKTSMLPQLTNLMSGVMTTVNVVKNLCIGIIIAVYALSGKRHFMAQAKKLLYSVLDVSRANAVLENLRYAHGVFGGFINGKLLDSLIIGLLCFVGMVILRMPYAVLISVIIGVTNIIPFFGPFIGAIPSVLLIFLIDPMKALYFAIFVLALQQFDGNILGPRILGESTGLSGFWVMFALLVAGGLWGIVGMLVGVPLFAVLYTLCARRIRSRLEDRSLPGDTDAYDALQRIDEETHQRVTYGKGTPPKAEKAK